MNKIKQEPFKPQPMPRTQTQQQPQKTNFIQWNQPSFKSTNQNPPKPAPRTISQRSVKQPPKFVYFVFIKLFL